MEKRGIEWLWESGALGDTDPQTLQYTLVVDSNTHGNTRTRRTPQAQIWRLHSEEHN